MSVYIGTASGYTSGKRFGPITTTHRNYHAANNKNRDSTKCSWIHGYGRYVEVYFTCDSLSDEGWVYDFGDCGYFKEWLKNNFDHKTLISSDDPELEKIMSLHDENIMSVVVIPNKNGWNPSIEGSCKWVFDEFNHYLRHHERNVRVKAVKIFEHENNWAQYAE